MDGEHGYRIRVQQAIGSKLLEAQTAITKSKLVSNHVRSFSGCVQQLRETQNVASADKFAQSHKFREKHDMRIISERETTYQCCYFGEV